MNGRCFIHGVLYIAIFTRKHLCWSLFFNGFIKKRQQGRYSPVNIEILYFIINTILMAASESFSFYVSLNV